MLSAPHTAASTLPPGLSFVVHGKVQGVFFRKHTQAKARALGLTGWVANEADGTVVGSAHGSRAALEELGRWLQEEGSPKSRVERAELEWCEEARAPYRTFFIKR